jgi:4a-hydroxytetrahydrobiopterin dehydratase
MTDTDPGLPDWRLLLRLNATYRADSYADAAAFVQQVANHTSAADIDLRAPGLVQLELARADVETAKAISRLAQDAGLTPEPLSGVNTEVAIDAMDIPRIKPFWKAVLGYEDDGAVALADPNRIGPPFWFQQMDEPRTERNRFHIDVTVPHDAAHSRIDAAIAAGGTLVTDKYARSFWVLADAEGNEACICTWQDR